jgi:hypothetical protein
MKLFQLFRITGVANSTIYDGGLKSTPSEPKKLVAVHVQLDKYAATDDNEFKGILETMTVFDFPEKMLPTELFSNTSQAADGGKMKSIPVDHDIEPGEIFKAGMKCSATAVNARGAYEYEIVKS